MLVVPKRSRRKLINSALRPCLRYSRTLRSATKNFNWPRRCWNTTNTSLSGARTTLRWLSEWTAPSEEQLALRESDISKPHWTRSFFPNFGKRERISTLNMEKVAVHFLQDNFRGP